MLDEEREISDDFIFVDHFLFGFLLLHLESIMSIIIIIPLLIDYLIITSTEIELRVVQMI